MRQTKFVKFTPFISPPSEKVWTNYS